MGQRTLAFTMLLLREISYNSLEKHGLLVVYAKQSFIQHTWGITKEQYTNQMQQSKHRFGWITLPSGSVFSNQVYLT
jgi:hypothetical protein